MQTSWCVKWSRRPIFLSRSCHKKFYTGQQGRLEGWAGSAEEPPKKKLPFAKIQMDVSRIPELQNSRARIDQFGRLLGSLRNTHMTVIGCACVCVCVCVCVWFKTHPIIPTLHGKRCEKIGLSAPAKIGESYSIKCVSLLTWLGCVISYNKSQRWKVAKP